MPINTDMPINNNYSGTIYDMGDAIPNYVNSVYTPHVWYDQSKRYQQFNNVFEKLMVSEGMLLGDSEDDMWTMEEILEEVLKYLNLHIVQHGFDYYIFDWETSKTDTQVIWLDIFTGDTYTATYSVINVPVSAYASDDTQLTMSDVYNQISVKDDITELEDVIFSPFDDDQLTDLTYPQKYCTEYAAPGEGKTAFGAFYDMVRNNAVPEVNEWTTAYKKNWYMKLKKPLYWEFLKNGQSIYNNLPMNGNGEYYNQWQLPKYLFEHPMTAAMLSFGKGDKFNKDNLQEHENVTDFDDYICINVGGNGVDEQSMNVYNSETSWFDQPGTQYPLENDLKNSGLEIRYNYPTEGNYSPANEDIHNYLVFSGKMLLTTNHECTGGNGKIDLAHGFHVYMEDFRDDEDTYNMMTEVANNPNRGGNYADWMVFKRRLNLFSQYSQWSSNQNTARGQNQYKCVSNPDNDSGAYYGILFYDTMYPEDTAANQNGAHENRNMANLMAPFDRGSWSKRFCYSYDKNSYMQDANGVDYNIIPCVDIVACQLRIGDKLCREIENVRIENGLRFYDKAYEWVSIQDLMAQGAGVGYDVLNDGTVRYKAYIYLSMDINKNEFVIGDEHDFWNNVRTSMGIGKKKGIAIPLPYDEHLSGELQFSIFGPVNNSMWDNGIRRHGTWFRPTTTQSNNLSILPHVGQIWIKNFKVELCSDRGKTVEFKDADIVYKSDEQKKFINKKDIDFKFTTALTPEEATSMKVNITQNRSDITDTDGNAILSITDNHTQETDKPEKIYVDAYYREYCEPRTIIETTVHDGNMSTPFNKYNISFMNGKTYYFVAEEKNLAMNTTKLRLKER